jgi:hypothetical protein
MMARMSPKRRLWWRSLLYRVAGAILAVAIVLLILEMIVRGISEPT